jgi:outer membrane protein OmpA-like peptidoglycan-associated protein
MQDKIFWIVIASCLVAVTSAEAQSSKGNWQTPGQIQTPSGPWQKPGDIQIPKGIEAVKSVSAQCMTTISVVADALFDFNKSILRPDAEETLAAAAPQITKIGKHKVIVEGYTDSIGSPSYNMTLSSARATTVRDWLVARAIIPPDSGVQGFGLTRPVAPNTTPDGKDNPLGRQKNRRVEIVVDTCS